MLKVEDILMVKGPDVIVVSSATTVLEAVKLMARAKVGSVIIRDDNEVKGIFTERDLLVRVVAVGKDPSSTPIAEVMSSPVRSCRLDDDVNKCAKEFANLHIRHLAIIEDGSLVGLISSRDVLTAELSSQGENIRAIEAIVGRGA